MRRQGWRRHIAIRLIVAGAVGAAAVVLFVATAGWAYAPSVGWMAAALVYLVIATITAIGKQDWWQLLFSVLMSALVIVAHRANIDRILRGTENKISASMFSKKK